MKATEILLWAVLLATIVAHPASAQGTFIYDQQSADESTGGGVAGDIESNQPIGQSFTPALDFVGFIRLRLADYNSGNGTGTTVYLNLRSDSITGTILASTEPVFMPDGFGVGTGNRGYTNFFFPQAVAVIPETAYYFQPVVLSGDPCAIAAYPYNYPRGTAYIQGVASLNDLWFREGIIVPEPSTWLIIVLGAATIFVRFVRRRSGA